MSVKTLSLSLEFSGVVLPIAQDENGRDVVPLKPIIEVFGVQWEGQRVKVQTPGMQRRLGTCTLDIYGAGQQREMVCIRVDRVTAYLFSINPENVRAGGNEEASAYLERKWDEWADVLHAYEQHIGGTLRISQRSKQVRDMLAVMREKRAVSSPADRAHLEALTQRMAADLGLPHQQELPVEGHGAA